MCALCSKGNRKEAEMKNPAPLQSKQVKFVKSLAPPFMAAMLVLSPICNDPGKI